MNGRGLIVVVAFFVSAIALGACNNSIENSVDTFTKSRSGKPLNQQQAKTAYQGLCVRAEENNPFQKREPEEVCKERLEDPSLVLSIDGKTYEQITDYVVRDVSKSVEEENGVELSPAS